MALMYTRQQGIILTLLEGVLVIHMCKQRSRGLMQVRGLPFLVVSCEPTAKSLVFAIIAGVLSFLTAGWWGGVGAHFILSPLIWTIRASSWIAMAEHVS